MVIELKDVLQKSWPTEVAKTLTYRLGEIPMHEYVKHNAENMPNQIAYHFYGNELTWLDLNDAMFGELDFKTLYIKNFLIHLLQICNCI